MKRLIFLSFLCVGYLSAQITVVDVTPEYLKTNDLQVIDVRMQKEWSEGHLKDAIRIPIRNDDGISLNYNFAAQALEAGIDPEKPVAVIGTKGKESGVAAKILDSHGFKNVINLEGGVDVLVEKYNYELEK